MGNGSASRNVKSSWASTAMICLSFLAILVLAPFLRWADVSLIPGSATVLLLEEDTFGSELLNCSSSSGGNETVSSSCPSNHHLLRHFRRKTLSSGGKCPDYFKWIHKDLEPWKDSGISRETLESGKGKANFRLVIVNGEAYVEKYEEAFQTRDVFTVWGILQLLRLYPGKVPDLELMFWCGDLVAVNKTEYYRRDADDSATLSTSPPPVFHYCGHQDSQDIVFPDWTFWGWAETNIRPWKGVLEEIEEGNRRVKWINRAPYAYWKGNPLVSLERIGLFNDCHDEDRWKAHLYFQNWEKETEQGFKNSKLADQCTHRYKIYVEGRTWSVSQKYILACDSMNLAIEPQYYDFYSRSMVPLRHYWPVSSSRKCRDIKFAVEWGNAGNHSRQAQEIGREGSRYVREEVKMKYVYDYMLHLLRQYAKLLRFRPRIPERAEKVCVQRMACSSGGLWRRFMAESMVNSPSETLPCALPPAFQPPELEAFLDNNEVIKQQVRSWEKQFSEGVSLN